MCAGGYIYVSTRLWMMWWICETLLLFGGAVARKLHDVTAIPIVFSLIENRFAYYSNRLGSVVVFKALIQKREEMHKRVPLERSGGQVIRCTCAYLPTFTGKGLNFTGSPFRTSRIFFLFWCKISSFSWHFTHQSSFSSKNSSVSRQRFYTNTDKISVLGMKAKRV